MPGVRIDPAVLLLAVIFMLPLTLNAEQPARTRAVDRNQYPTDSENRVVKVARITSVTPNDCFWPEDTITVSGSGFGKQSDSKLVFSNSVHQFSLPAIRWAPNRITARIPTHKEMGFSPSSRLEVGIVRGGTWVSNAGITVDLCGIVGQEKAPVVSVGAQGTPDNKKSFDIGSRSDSERKAIAEINEEKRSRLGTASERRSRQNVEIALPQIKQVYQGRCSKPGDRIRVTGENFNIDAILVWVLGRDRHRVKLLTESLSGQEATLKLPMTGNYPTEVKTELRILGSNGELLSNAYANFKLCQDQKEARRKPRGIEVVPTVNGQNTAASRFGNGELSGRRNPDRGQVVAQAGNSPAEENLEIIGAVSPESSTREVSPLKETENKTPAFRSDPRAATIRTPAEINRNQGGEYQNTNPQFAAYNYPESSNYEPLELLISNEDVNQSLTDKKMLEAWGGVLSRQSRLNSLGIIVSTYRFPSDESLKAALYEMRRTKPGAQIDFNARYRVLETLDWSNQTNVAESVGWNTVSFGCVKKLRVGMLDTGVFGQHPALAGQSLITRDFLPIGEIRAGRNHGTAIATILIAKPMGRFQGLLPDVSLISGAVFKKVENQLVSTTEWLLAGLDWLLQENVDVVNLSLGGVHNQLLEQALKTFMNKGKSVVAAAGREKSSGRHLFPATMSGVISVIAVDSKLVPEMTTPSGSYIDLAAPGVDIWAGAEMGGGQYVSGSSYAAPYVTALVGALGHHNKSQIFSMAKDLGAPGKDEVYGHGLIQFPEQLCH